MFSHFEITRGNIWPNIQYGMVWRYLGMINRKKDKESDFDSDENSKEES